MNETTTKPGLKFTKQAPRVYTALGSTSYTKLNGATSRIDVAFRIDGRGEEGYRVDLKTAAYLPWESVDGGTPLRTLKAAKAHARRHLGRMRAQQALTPTD